MDNIIEQSEPAVAKSIGRSNLEFNGSELTVSCCQCLPSRKKNKKRACKKQPDEGEDEK